MEVFNVTLPADLLGAAGVTSGTSRIKNKLIRSTTSAASIAQKEDERFKRWKIIDVGGAICQVSHLGSILSSRLIPAFESLFFFSSSSAFFTVPASLFPFCVAYIHVLPLFALILPRLLDQDTDPFTLLS